MNRPTTESAPEHDALETKSTADLIGLMHAADRTVADAVGESLPQIAVLAEAVYHRLAHGGRLFYIGAGTSGRLGILDASECPPTFGVPSEWVTGIIAGGDSAIRKAVEGAEDDTRQAIADLRSAGLGSGDFVLGIAASGKTPYVLGGILDCRKEGIATGGLSCNPGSLLSKACDYAVEVCTGAEVVAGSTRMKAGTATKMVLNMISTSVMIRLGRVKGNKMVDMQLTNAKLNDRAEQMLMEELRIGRKQAKELLRIHQNVRKAIDAYVHQQGKTR
ncbi:N-acetylmuramic acid 6-phosphate etherase [bacterium]|nr:N-acetylmuramic acid 6-phosphate etherase [bacterium]